MGGRRGRTREIETDDVGAENGATGERNQHPEGQYKLLSVREPGQHVFKLFA